MKKPIKKWLDKLAKANEESFGTGPLDCCELNKDSSDKNSSNFKNSNNSKTNKEKAIKNKSD